MRGILCSRIEGPFNVEITDDPCIAQQSGLPTHIRPPTPGEIIREEFLAHMTATRADLARAMGLSIRRLNAILDDDRTVTADTAVRLSKCLGCSPLFWLGLQASVDLYDAIVQMDPREFARIPNLVHATSRSIDESRAE